MIELVEILLDYLALKEARRNALKIKKKAKNIEADLTSYKCSMENTFKDYIVVLFPIGEIDYKKSEKAIWYIIEIKNTKKIANFKEAHKTSLKPKKMKLKQSFAEEYPSIVLKPNSKIEIEITINSRDLAKKINFEVAFRRKLLNSKIYINSITI